MISGGALNGDIIINTNGSDGSTDDEIDLLDPTTGFITVIGHQATRGDFVSPDVSNGTLLLTYSDAVERLGLTSGTIGSATPEPSTLALFAMALGGLALLRRHPAKS